MWVQVPPGTNLNLLAPLQKTFGLIIDLTKTFVFSGWKRRKAENEEAGEEEDGRSRRTEAEAAEAYAMEKFL